MVNICQEGQSVFLFQIWGEVLFSQILRKGSIIKKKKKSKLVNVTINMVDSFNIKKKQLYFKIASQTFFFFFNLWKIATYFLFFIFYFLRKNCLLS